MEHEIRLQNSLLLEDFDIQNMYKLDPTQKVGVNVNAIYIQIAKYSQNPSRVNEIRILKEALIFARKKNYTDTHYTIMELSDVIKCFNKYLKRLPKSTFLPTNIIVNEE